MFSSTFQGKFNFQGLFKAVLYIQVLFKPVRTLGFQTRNDVDIDPWSRKAIKLSLYIPLFMQFFSKYSLMLIMGAKSILKRFSPFWDKIIPQIGRFTFISFEL